MVSFLCAGGKAPLLRGLASGSNTTDVRICASVGVKRPGCIVDFLFARRVLSLLSLQPHAKFDEALLTSDGCG